MDRRIWSLSEERIAWDKTLSQRRRDIPKQVEEMIRDLLQQETEHEPALDTVSEDPSDSGYKQGMSASWSVTS